MTDYICIHTLHTGHYSLTQNGGVYWNSADGTNARFVSDESTPVRFFHDDYDLKGEPNTDEIVFSAWKRLVENGGVIKIERHTVFENGVDQICYTLDNLGG